MSTRAHDPWPERLSEYLDGELAGEQRSALETHLTACSACRELLADLRRLVGAARVLPARAPERDLWPALAAQLAPPRARPGFPRWPLAFAAGVLLTLGALRLFGARAPAEEHLAAQGEGYLLLLHEPEGFGRGQSAAEHAELVERYSRWARELGSRCLGGEELEEGGLALRPGLSSPETLPAGAHIGGYFLLAARDREEALALARTCPHLDQGGSLELRRIRTP